MCKEVGIELSVNYHVQLRVHAAPWADPERGQMSDPAPPLPEKSHKYRVS